MALTAPVSPAVSFHPPSLTTSPSPPAADPDPTAGSYQSTPPPPPHAHTMKLSVRTSNENTLCLTVPDNATVEDLKIAAIVALPPATRGAPHLTPSCINLWYSGHKLDYSKPLRSYNITPDSVVANPNLVVYLTLDVTSSEGSGDGSPTMPVSPQVLAAAATAVASLASAGPADSAILDDNEEADQDDLLLQQQKKTKKSKSKSKSRSKSKSKKCSFSNCTSAPLRMVGDCQFCQGKFCSKHRLLESHNCKGLKICKDKCYERNALKLQSEQTVASKV